MKMALVLYEDIDTIWGEVSQHLLPAIQFANMETLETLRKNLNLEGHGLWILFNENQNIFGAATTALMEYPDRKALVLEYLGAAPGIMKEYLFLVMDMFKSYAYDTGCDVIELQGRKGWGKALHKYGAVATRYIYEMPPGNSGLRR
jgi:hypothetical protein